MLTFIQSIVYVLLHLISNLVNVWGGVLYYSHSTDEKVQKGKLHTLCYKLVVTCRDMGLQLPNPESAY